MLYANRRKIDVLMGISGLICLVVVLCLLQTRHIHASDPWRTNFLSQTALLSNDEAVLGIFEGITPCDSATPPIPQIADSLICEQMIWKLTLYEDAVTGDPTTYQLTSAYGLSQQGTTGLIRGGTNKDLEGKWTIVQGTQIDPNTVVYQLNPDDPQAAINFMKLDDNILHLLTQDMSLMVGNAAWSYTLNRTDKSIVSDDPDFTLSSTPVPITSAASDTGEFEGRIPCAETILALHNISASGCQRVKMGLTLQESTFEMYSVYVGTGDIRYTATGTWTVLQGTNSDPEALVYQLNPDGSQSSLFFLKADDNHLFLLDSDLNLMVGDALMSFTLSRVVD